MESDLRSLLSKAEKIAEIAVFNKLVSDVDTANDFFLDQGDMNEMKVQIDGKDYWNW